ncbi:hypothetical protein AHAS_Ahas15G0155400 [Arachis hypogaea]
MFDKCLISAFIERWRPETHTFHLPWGEASITLEDVAYHTGLRTTGEPVGVVPETFSGGMGTQHGSGLRIYWAPGCHHRRRKGIGYTCAVEMAATVRGFRSMQPVIMESALLCYTYHSLCTAASHDVTCIAGCMPLLVSWIYHRFPCFSPAGYDVVKFPLASKYTKVASRVSRPRGCGTGHHLDPAAGWR